MTGAFRALILRKSGNATVTTQALERDSAKIVMNKH